MKELILAGLDGSNPLAFLAAIGVLNALSDAHEVVDPKLSWVEEGAWRPVLHTENELTLDSLVELLLRDLKTWIEEPVIHLRYGKKGAEAHDLKPPPGKFQEFLEGLIEAGHVSRERRSLDFAAAFATDVAVDNSGNTKPTMLHFTAGQQQFLDMVLKLIRGVSVEDLHEAVAGPWRYQSPLPVLQWDNTSTRDYALRADNPSNSKKLGVAGAEWLAFRGLSFIRAFPIRDRLHTAGCSGGWKSGVFRWPLWTVPLPRTVVQTVMLLDPSGDGRRRDQPEVAVENRRERSIGVVFEAAIRRSDQGGYGSFSPSKVV